MLAIWLGLGVVALVLIVARASRGATGGARRAHTADSGSPVWIDSGATRDHDGGGEGDSGGSGDASDSSDAGGGDGGGGDGGGGD